MKPVSQFLGLVLLTVWGVALAVGVWPPLMLGLAVGAVFGCLKLGRTHAAKQEAIKPLPGKFRETDDTLVLDCLKALEGQDWLTGRPEFARFLQLATTDHWLAITPELAHLTYQQLVWNSVTPLDLVLPRGEPVSSPRQAHELARQAMDRLAHDAEILARVLQWKRDADAKAAAVVAAHAAPSETTWGMAFAGGFVLFMALSVAVGAPLLSSLMGLDLTERLLNKAPVFFGHLRGQLESMGPSFSGILFAGVVAGVTGWGVFKAFARLQNANQPPPFNNKLLLAAMAGSAAFLLVNPPVTVTLTTARLCSAMEAGFGIAAQEGPDARQAASDAYRSLCLATQLHPMVAPAPNMPQRVSDASPLPQPPSDTPFIPQSLRDTGTTTSNWVRVNGERQLVRLQWDADPGLPHPENVSPLVSPHLSDTGAVTSQWTRMDAPRKLIHWEWNADARFVPRNAQWEPTEMRYSARGSRDLPTDRATTQVGAYDNLRPRLMSPEGREFRDSVVNRALGEPIQATPAPVAQQPLPVEQANPVLSREQAMEKSLHEMRVQHEVTQALLRSMNMQLQQQIHVLGRQQELRRAQDELSMRSALPVVPIPPEKPANDLSTNHDVPTFN